MFADVAAPPTFCLDWAYLGFPHGVIAFVAVMVSLVLMFVVLARRQMHKGRILLLCLIVFVAADLLVYFLGLAQPRTPRPGATPEFNRTKKAD